MLIRDKGRCLGAGAMKRDREEDKREKKREGKVREK